MEEPQVPGGDGRDVELSCGRVIRATDVDIGMRGFDCPCGKRHAIVTDVHPPSRFVPEDVVAVLRETTETDDEFGEFGTPHLMGAVMEEFPDSVVVADLSDDGAVGYALLWVTESDPRRLHEVVVELVVELMEHAMSHGDDAKAAEFERRMAEFDVETFVDAYRDRREFEDEFDAPA